MEVSWLEQRGAVLARRALCSSSCSSSQPRRSLDTRLSSAAAKACALFCVAVVVVILSGACLRRRRVPHAVLVQEGAGRGAAVHSCGGAGGSASRRDACAAPCFASIRCTPALVTNTEGCWRGWEVAAHWFCHRRGVEWTERLRASYTTSTTCNLHSLLNYLFVSTLDACLKETCCCLCRQRRSASQVTPSQLTLSQLNSKPARSSQFAPSQFSGLAWVELAWGELG